MKNTFLLIILFLSFISCEKDETSKSYFNVDRINELNIDNLTYFFGTEELDTLPSPFIDYPGYMGGIGYENSNGKVYVSVFESYEKAIECMQIRIDHVACVIEKDTSGLFAQPLWYSECPGKTIYRSQYNTIIEAKFYSSDVINADELLLNVTADIANRIDNLSE